MFCSQFSWYFGLRGICLPSWPSYWLYFKLVSLCKDSKLVLLIEFFHLLIECRIISLLLLQECVWSSLKVSTSITEKFEYLDFNQTSLSRSALSLSPTKFLRYNFTFLRFLMMWMRSNSLVNLFSPFLYKFAILLFFKQWSKHPKFKERNPISVWHQSSFICLS